MKYLLEEMFINLLCSILLSKKKSLRKQNNKRAVTVFFTITVILIIYNTRLFAYIPDDTLPIHGIIFAESIQPHTFMKRGDLGIRIGMTYINSKGLVDENGGYQGDRLILKLEDFNVIGFSSNMQLNVLPGLGLFIPFSYSNCDGRIIYTDSNKKEYNVSHERYTYGFGLNYSLHTWMRGGEYGTSISGLEWDFPVNAGIIRTNSNIDDTVEKVSFFRDGSFISLLSHLRWGMFDGKFGVLLGFSIFSLNKDAAWDLIASLKYDISSSWSIGINFIGLIGNIKGVSDRLPSRLDVLHDYRYVNVTISNRININN